ncbi:uncharacterized protein HD556DRAFT_1304455 [Suillus plorans]|uniref:DUF6830 domain-containing protein n=1 Tax=Suillus plorans TaxID=116603 RepID=A0A9P7DRC3_9AGAM|nr:uncharacterized protein HD556DRAFT_1304455 [Suillus plorans]KAG1801323.1 hypothetical protein HD556DRAFT_1304455 [Suillus plorans]
MSNFSDEDNMEGLRQYDLIQLNSTLPLTKDPMAVDNTIDEGPSYEQGEDTKTASIVKKNLYYPFSDRREWQLALWLLHSGLSMVQINDFLALDIINDQKIYEVELNHYLAVHVGSLKLFLYYMARKVYHTVEKLSRIYTEWMTGEHAWEMQSALPHGATLLEPLKLAAQNGTMLSDPLGHSHYCFTMLASYIADMPEAMMLACVGGKTSPVTMAMYKYFGDPFQHEPQTQSKTLVQLDMAFFCEAQKFRLNGIDKPFWSDWLLADPSRFLIPESLHHIHKQFLDHDVQWIILAVGGSKIDFRFSVIQPTTGYRHFHGGISKLKQVTGHCHQDVQQSIIAASADAGPAGVIVAVHALMHFRYLVQSLCIDDKDLGCITAALSEFHVNKHAIIAAGLHQGKGNKGNKVINNWQIPKLELMQNIVPSIRNSGVIAQWSVDVTEHAHITVVKDPARSTNNNNYDPQICHYLDRANKCNQFELATSLLDHSQREDPGVVGDELVEEDDKIDDDMNDFPAELLSSIQIPAQPRPIMNHFSLAKILQHKEIRSLPVPLRSFTIGCTALHLSYDPSIRNATVDEVAIMFCLPDL